RRPALPAGSRRLHEARLHPSLPRSAEGRAAAPAHGRALERGGPLRRPVGSGGLRLDTGRQDAGVRRPARHDRGRSVPGVPHLRARRRHRSDPHARVPAGLLGRPDRVPRRPHGGVRGSRFQRSDHRTSDLYTIGIDGSGIRDLSRSLDRDPGDLTWAPDGKAIYFTAPDRGAINVHVADLAGGVRDLTQGAQGVSLASVARTLVAVGVLSDPTHPADVVRLDLRKPSGLARFTNVNDDVLGDKRLARTEEIWYGSSGATRVQGWIVTPPSFKAGRKYPLLLEIHGGPFAMYNVGFSYMFQNFAANGYVVLFVNPRGSTGYGDRFSNGIDHDYPGPDSDDLMAGVDAVIGRGF